MKNYVAVYVPTRAYTKILLLCQSMKHGPHGPFKPQYFIQCYFLHLVPIKEDFFRVFNWTIQGRRGGDRPNN